MHPVHCNAFCWLPIYNGPNNGRKKERIEKEFERVLQTCIPRVLTEHAFTLRCEVTRCHKVINYDVDYNQ